MADAKQVLEAWIDAFEARDAERILDTLADDVVIETESLGTPLHGKDLVRQLLAESLDAYESIEVEPRTIVASGRDVAALITMRVRIGEDLELLGEMLQTAGKHLEIVGALFVHVDESGKIARIGRVRDTFGVIQQLGLPLEQVGRLMSKMEAVVGEHRRRAA